MRPQEFLAKWRKVDLTERSAAHQHFFDLCELVGHRKPADVDPTGESFTVERGATKLGGGDGWADVWKKGFLPAVGGDAAATGGEGDAEEPVPE
jgi:hypothetical protein